MTSTENAYVADTSDLLQGIKVVLVEDDEDSRELLVEIRQGAGAEVEAAATAAGGFSAFQSFHPQVLISDIGLPGEDGLSLARRIRELEAQGRQTPLIALTAYTSPRERSRALEAGFNQHIGKPYDLNTLLHSVHSIAQTSSRP